MITPLLLTEVTLPREHPRHGGGPYPVYGFVIDHAGGPIIVDTGVGEGHEWVEEHFRPIHHGLGAALAGLGLGVGDVRVVINTHLHFDHCGQNPLFPGVPIVVQASELAVARTGGHTVDEWVDFPGVCWQAVDGEAQVAPGVTVVPTPGHTLGHQSVVVEHPGGIDVIAGQAVHDADEMEEGASAEPLDGAAAAATAASVHQLGRRRPRRVFFSHDRRVWTPSHRETPG
jgi:N-acyl homoserine lactone hydrolase